MWWLKRDRIGRPRYHRFLRWNGSTVRTWLHEEHLHLAFALRLHLAA